MTVNNEGAKEHCVFMRISMMIKRSLFSVFRFTIKNIKESTARKKLINFDKNVNRFVVYFDQRLGAAHSKRCSKYAILMYLMAKS